MSLEKRSCVSLHVHGATIEISLPLWLRRGQKIKLLKLIQSSGLADGLSDQVSRVVEYARVLRQMGKSK